MSDLKKKISREQHDTFSASVDISSTGNYDTLYFFNFMTFFRHHIIFVSHSSWTVNFIFPLLQCLTSRPFKLSLNSQKAQDPNEIKLDFQSIFSKSLYASEDPPCLSCLNLEILISNLKRQLMLNSLFPKVFKLSPCLFFQTNSL